MKKIITFLVLFFASYFVQGQVGINTTNPNAQLDIRSSNQATPSNYDGILIPKVDAFPVTNPTAAQQGMLVYLTTTSGTDLSGFYYWDNITSDWKPIIGTGVGTLDQAYDFGGAGNGRTITADSGAVLINGTDGFISSGSINSGAVIPNATGTRMFWYPRKAAFRAGFTLNSHWDNSSIGNFSTAFGYSTVASGSASTAFGSFTSSYGDYSVSFGNSSIASGNTSTAFGYQTSAIGISSTVFGVFSTANNYASTAFGNQSFAGGDYSTVFGTQNRTFSYGETVLGIGATTYTPSINGSNHFLIGNANDRLFVIGNAIDTNSNLMVDTAERSDAMIVLKNGLTRLPSTTNAMITASDGKAVVTKEYLQSNNWSLTGNNGTNSTTNFIGTTDDVDLVFKRNSIFFGRLANTNISLGREALLLTTTGSSNTAIGDNALKDNTTGFGNTSVGSFALDDASTANFNTAIGERALAFNVLGENNTALGSFTMRTNINGSNNTTLGSLSNVSVDGLSNATAVGANASVGASNSLVLGSVNGINNATSSVNVGIGTTNPNNKLHIADNSTSTTIGQFYLEQQGTGDALIHIGNTGARHFNLGLDTSTDSFKIGTSATTATAVTIGTLMTVQASGEVGIGTISPAEKLHVSGQAGLTAVRIANTSSVGSTSNVALDFFRNTAINTDWRIYNIGANLTVGNSGDDLATVNDLYQFQGSRFIPMNDGTQSLGQAANRWNTVFATNGTINTSDRREKKEIQPLHYGLNQLMQLKPITFKWNNSQIDNGSKHLGFIAQDLQEVLPEIVVDSEWVEEEGQGKVWRKAPLLGVNYVEIVPVLVQSIQEQQTIIDAQRKEIENQKAILEQVLQRLKNLEKTINN